MKYKEQILPILEEIFMPVCSAISEFLSVPYDAKDLEVIIGTKNNVSHSIRLSTTILE